MTGDRTDMVLPHVHMGGDDLIKFNRGSDLALLSLLVLVKSLSLLLSLLDLVEVM